MPEQTKRSMGSYCQENHTEVSRSFTSNILLCWTLLERRSADLSLSEYNSNKDNELFVRFWQAISFSLTPRYVIGLIRTIEIKKIVVVKARKEDFGTPNAWQRRKLQNHCSSVTRSKFPLHKLEKNNIQWHDSLEIIQKDQHVYAEIYVTSLWS